MHPELLSTLLNWLPIVLIMAVWIYFMRQMRSPNGLSFSAYLEKLLQTQQEHNMHLLAVVERMDKRIAALEDKERASGASL